MLALVLLAFWPYFVFHVTFQETETIRYALPVLVPVAGLAIVALWGLPRRVALVSAVLIVAATAGIADAPLRAYAATASPIFRAFEHMAIAARESGAAPEVVALHQRIGSESVQARLWMVDQWSFRFLPYAQPDELDAAFTYWRSGATSAAWLIADPLRRDLARLDRRAREKVGAYRWDAGARTLVAFARPTDVDLWRLERPRWMLGRGWAVTPEIGGVTTARNLGPHLSPAVAYLQRDSAPLWIVVGGRHLGGPGDGPVRLTAVLDGRELASWTVTASARQFSQWIELPAGVPAGSEAYATLLVSASGANGAPAPMVGLESFDAAPFDAAIWGYADGWHEPEQNPDLGTFWRWMTREASLLVEAPAGALTMRVAGEAPLAELGGAVVLRVLMNGVEVAQRPLTRLFDEVFTLDASARAGSHDRITLAVDRDFSPSEIEDSPDRRRLSLRIASVTIGPGD
jgi:hypothetical protein